MEVKLLLSHRDWEIGLQSPSELTFQRFKEVVPRILRKILLGCKTVQTFKEVEKERIHF